MATIRASEKAPAGDLHYVFSTGDFDLSAGGSYETDDQVLLGEARAHPWLEAELDASDVVQFVAPDRQVKPEDDSQSAVNSIAFDSDEIRKVEEAKSENFGSPTAIDAGLDQGDNVSVGGTAFTFAADEAAEDEVVAPVEEDPEPEPELPPVSDRPGDTF